MQRVVLNRAAAQLEQRGAAAVEELGAQLEQQAAQQGAGVAGALTCEGVQDDAEEGPAPWVPRVVVLGQLHAGISTAERAGQVVVVRPSHLAAPRPAVPARTPVVVLPASARKAPAATADKTPARTIAKLGFTPAPIAAMGGTPVAAGTTAKGATPAACFTSSRSAGKTPAAGSVLKSAGGVPLLLKSMLKEDPGVLVVDKGMVLGCKQPASVCNWQVQETGVLEAPALPSSGTRKLLERVHCCPLYKFIHLSVSLNTISCICPGCPCAAADGAVQPAVVLDSVELPGWLFNGEQEAPGLAEAAALAEEELEPGVQGLAAPPQQEAATGAEQAGAVAPAGEQPAEAKVEQAASEAAVGADVGGPASPPAAAGPQEPLDAASQRRQPAQPAAEAAASEGCGDDEEAEEADYCHVCDKSGEPGQLLGCA